MRGRKLDTRIVIQQRTVTKSPRTGAVTGEVWTTFAEPWADVDDVRPSRTEKLADGINIQNRPVRIYIRHLPGLTTEMRVVIGSRVLKIVGGPAMIGRRDGMEIICEDESTAGRAP